LSFTLDYTTDRGKIRLLIHDISATDYVFEDAAIDGALEQNSDSVLLAAADLCRSLAAKYARSSFDFEIPGAIRLDRRKMSDYYAKISKEYQDRAMGGTDFVSEFIDSYAIRVGVLGQDQTEYVGD